MPISLRLVFLLMLVGACGESVVPCYQVPYCAQYDSDKAISIFTSCVGHAPDDERDSRTRSCMKSAIVLTCTETKIVGRRSSWITSGELKALANGKQHLHQECAPRRTD